MERVLSEIVLPLTYDFYNRFRSGEMPMGIQGYGMYNMLEAAAPEIKGMWSMHLLPGTQTQDVKIDRTEGASGTATIMINHPVRTKRQKPRLGSL